MSKELTTYNSAKVSVIVGGFSSSGLAEGSFVTAELPPHESSKKWLKRRRGQRMRGVVASKYVPMYF